MSGVLVTGMHRSGTSAVAGIVESCGLTGGTGHVLDGTSDNAAGFHEYQQTVIFNDQWLSRLGGSWSAPPRARAVDIKEIDPVEVRTAQKELEFFDPSFTGWYVKDPRLCLLLPLWDRFLLRRAPVIFVVRDPGEVAESLVLRERMSGIKALALWAEYVRSLLVSAGERPSLVLDYRMVREDPSGTAGLIGDFLVGCRLVSQAPSTAADVVRPGLKRSSAEGLAPTARRLADELGELHGALVARHGESVPTWDATAASFDWVDEILDDAHESWRMQRYAEQLKARLDRAERTFRNRVASAVSHFMTPSQGG